MRTSSAPPPVEEAKLNRNAVPFAPKPKNQQEGLTTIKEEGTKKDSSKPELRANATSFVPKGTPKAASTQPTAPTVPAPVPQAPTYTPQGIPLILC